MANKYFIYIDIDILFWYSNFFLYQITPLTMFWP